MISSVIVDDLCKCQHCDKIFKRCGHLTFLCPNCHKQIDSETYGLGTSYPFRQKWIDATGNWTTVRPTQDYRVGDFGVKIDLQTLGGAGFGC